MLSLQDAHNLILNYDDKTSFFAVYDGHGGSEIAIYCSKYLPEVLKETENYKNGKFGEALVEAFLKIDSDLLKANVIKELKKIAKFVEGNGDESEKSEEEFEDLDKLCEEGQMPLDEVLRKYKGGKSIPIKIKNNVTDESNSRPGSSKESASSEGSASGQVECSSSSGSLSLATASSSSKSPKSMPNILNDATISSSDQNNEVQDTSSCSKIPIKEAVQCSSPDSSSSNIKTNTRDEDSKVAVNGDIPVDLKSQDNEITTNENDASESVSSSSSGVDAATKKEETVNCESTKPDNVTDRYPKRAGSDSPGPPKPWIDDDDEDDDEDDEDEDEMVKSKFNLICKYNKI